MGPIVVPIAPTGPGLVRVVNVVTATTHWAYICAVVCALFFRVRFSLDFVLYRRQCLVAATTLTTSTVGAVVGGIGIGRRSQSDSRIDVQPSFGCSWSGPVDGGDRGPEVAPERLFDPRLFPPVLFTPPAPRPIEFAHLDPEARADHAQPANERPDR